MAGGMIWSFEMDEWCKFEWVTSITGSRVGHRLIEDTKPVERRERINYAGICVGKSVGSKFYNFT